MWEKLKALYSKYGEILRYLVIGGMTTAIDIGLFALLTGWGLHYQLAKVLTWFVAVAFAFVGNKWVVFRTKGQDLKTMLRESGSFFFMRILTLLFSSGFMYLTVDGFGWDMNLSNIICTAIVIILNYVLSRLFVFKKEQ